MFYPTTCVGLRYGPTYSHARPADFLGSLLHRRCHSARRPRVLSGFSPVVSADRYAFAVKRAIPSARGRFAPPSPRALLQDGLRNIDRMSIHHALTGWR